METIIISIHPDFKGFKNDLKSNEYATINLVLRFKTRYLNHNAKTRVTFAKPQKTTLNCSKLVAPSVTIIPQITQILHSMFRVEEHV